MTDKIIISLFDYSGTWSLSYRLAGYRVLMIDSKLGINIYDFNFKSLPRTMVHGILAAPPCTDFTKAGANLWVAKDLNGTTKKSLKLIYRTFDIIDYFNTTWWVLEQPPGRLETLIPSLKILVLCLFIHISLAILIKSTQFYMAVSILFLCNFL